MSVYEKFKSNRQIFQMITKMIEEDKNASYRPRGYVELFMNKFVHDEECENDDFNGDVLEFHYRVYKVKPQFPRDENCTFFKFDTIEEVANWIENTYFN